MEGILKIGALALIGAGCALAIRRGTPELSLILALCTGLVILWTAADIVTGVLDFFSELAQTAGIGNELLLPLLKTVGIAIVTRVAAQASRDAGAGTIAVFAEAAGSVAALSVAVPLMRLVLDLVAEMI